MKLIRIFDKFVLNYYPYREDSRGLKYFKKSKDGNFYLHFSYGNKFKFCLVCENLYQVRDLIIKLEDPNSILPEKSTLIQYLKQFDLIFMQYDLENKREIKIKIISDNELLKAISKVYTPETNIYELYTIINNNVINLEFGKFNKLLLKVR